MADAASAMVGVVVGAALSYVRDMFGWLTKRRGYEVGAAFELRKAQRAVNEKLRWLARPIPADVAVTIPDGIVSVDDRDLYLGENESFQVPLVFWESNYSQIVSLMSARRFQYFAEAFDLVQSFEMKFAEMKNAFRGTVGEPPKMAKACYLDLCDLKKKLDQSDGVRFVNKTLRQTT